MQSKNPVFIVGHPRSGTTITAWLLGNHPDIYYIEAETNCFNIELERFLKSPFKATALDVYKQHLQKTLITGTWEDVFEDFENDILSDSNPYPAVRLFLDKLLMANNKVSFVEKTPLHIFYVSTIERIYPDALFLIPKRDRGDLIRSMQKKEWCPLSDSGRQLFVDTIQEEIDRIKSLPNVLLYSLEQFTQSPDMIIDFLQPYFTNNWDNVRKAHKDRIDSDIPRKDFETWKRMA